MSHVVIWARVSSREQREGYSIDAQLRLAREKAGREGRAVLREFVVAESARRGAEREAFNAMYKWVRCNARREGIGYVLSHKLGRACRNIRDAVRMQELEDVCGVRLAFVDNQFGSGAAEHAAIECPTTLMAGPFVLARLRYGCLERRYRAFEFPDEAWAWSPCRRLRDDASIHPN